MTILTVHPFEGLKSSNGYRAGHLGDDYPTPRIYDYTAPSDAVIESIGGTYHQIIGRRADGSKWRLAEPAEILVSVGQEVKLGQVIGRNALFRVDSLYPRGAYRSPHLNAGGDTGRSPFPGIVTATKAQAAAIIAAAAAGDSRKRTVKKGINAVRRMGPGTKYNVAGEVLKAGTVGNFVAFAHGPASQGQPVGNDVWVQGISGHWFWLGSFTSQSTAGLVDKSAEFADLVVTLPPVVVVPVGDLPVDVEPPEGPIDPIEPPANPPVIVVVPPPVDATPVEPETPADPVEEPPVTDPTTPATPDIPVVTIPDDGPGKPPVITLPTADPVTPEQEQAAAELVNDYYNGNLLVGDEVIKRIRTIVPLIMGPLLGWLILRFPAVFEFLSSVQPGWRELVYGGVSAALGFGYWALAGWLGKRWPRVEKIMLGSSKRPVYINTKPTV